MISIKENSLRRRITKIKMTKRKRKKKKRKRKRKRKVKETTRKKEEKVDKFSRWWYSNACKSVKAVYTHAYTYIHTVRDVYIFFFCMCMSVNVNTIRIYIYKYILIYMYVYIHSRVSDIHICERKYRICVCVLIVKAALERKE